MFEKRRNTGTHVTDLLSRSVCFIRYAYALAVPSYLTRATRILPPTSEPLRDIMTTTQCNCFQRLFYNARVMQSQSPKSDAANPSTVPSGLFTKLLASERMVCRTYSLPSGMAPSTIETAPTLPPSAEPLSSAMAEMTSWGSSRCQEAMVCFELAPTVTAKTCSFGRREARRERNMSARW